MILVDVLLFKDPGDQKVPDPDPQHYFVHPLTYPNFDVSGRRYGFEG